jgi:predicted Zn-dependent peptidase
MRCTVKFRHALVVAFAAFAVSCGSAGTQEPSAKSDSAERSEAAERIAPAVAGDPMGVVIRKLPNGLTLMLSENHEEPRIETRVAVRAGSAKDPAEATGLAHYLEHMNFKGTSHLGTLDWEKEKPHQERIQQLYDELFGTKDEAKRAELYAAIDRENQEACKYVVASELDSLYDGLGARGLNAFTNNDSTVYVVNIPSNRLATWAAIEVERFRDPVYRLFQSELEAVYEEKNRGMDNKGRVIWEVLQEQLYPEHPYGTQTTIGTVEHLKNPSLTKIIDYFRKWYVPGNMLVAVSGDFDTKEALAILSEQFGKWEAKPVPPDPQFPMKAPTEPRRAELKFKAEEQVMLAWLTVPESHPDHEALVLADGLLDNGHTGFIDVNIKKAQKALGAQGSIQTAADSGFELLAGVPNPQTGQTLEDVEKLLLEQLELLKKGEFTEADMAAIVNDYDIREQTVLESNGARVSEMVDSFVSREPWERKLSYISRLRKVTKDDVLRVANKYFGSGYAAVYRRSGQPDLPKIDKPPFSKVETQKDTHSPYWKEMAAAPATPLTPRFLEASRDYTTQDLATGQLVAAKNPMNELFQLSFSFDVGTDQDNKLGIATSLIDFGGAGELDPVAFERALFALGTTISVGAGRQETTVSLAGQDKNLEASLDLMRAHFEKPTGVSDDTYRSLAQRIVGGRMFQKVQTPTIAAALSGYALRGPESDLLTQASNKEVTSWKADDLLTSVRSIWDMKRRVLYVGPRDAAAVAKVVDVAPPSGAPAKEPPARKAVRYVVPEKPRVLLVDKKGAQAQVSLLYPDGTYERPAVPLHRVYNEYMSGSMGAVVFQEIREFRSLAYDCNAVYRDAGWKDDSNVFLGQLGTQPDKTLDALEVLMRIVKEMPQSDVRMAGVRTSIDQTYRSAYVNFRTIPSAVVGWWRQGLTGDPRPYNWEHAMKLTVGDLAAFSSRFKSMPYTITIVGDKSRFDMAKLAEYGEVTELKPDQLFSW